MTLKLKDTLLLIGNRDSDRARLRDIFETSYNLLEAENPTQGVFLLKNNIDCVAAVLADLPLTDEEDIRMLAASCRAGTGQEIPLILLITPAGTGLLEESAFDLGAMDVVHKPYTPTGIHRRLQMLIDLYLHRWHLEQLVSEQSATIRNANQVMLDALSSIIEQRSTESGNHVLRIRRFTKILLKEVAVFCPEYNLTPDIIANISSAAALHDIGKISIPDAILNKPGRLTQEEFEVIKTHTTVGSRLIYKLSGIGDTTFLRYAYNIALYHHERWDGNGYPEGLKGDDIPICAQVVGLADAFDALTTARVYKPALPCDKAMNMILNGECGVFSPKLLECFKHVRFQFADLAHQYADGYSPKSDHIAVPLPGPVFQKQQLDSLQLSQVKYQTLLHYLNDTVIEFDLDNRLYHVIYNPNPDFESLIQNASFEDITLRLMTNGVHPDDMECVSEIHHYLTKDFLKTDLRKKIFSCRIYSPAQACYIPHKITLLRVNTQNTFQHIVIALFHRVTEKDGAATVATLTESPYLSPAMYGLVSSALRCLRDEHMTIQAGARQLYPLTGYTAEEIHHTFSDSYLQLIYPEDRGAFIKAMKAHTSQSGVIETEYRLMRSDGSYIWVLTKSRAYIEQDGREYIYLATRDNSRTKEMHRQLQATSERNQIIIDQSEGIVFDWDLISDTLTCSSKWLEHFGYEPVSENYSKQFGNATHFHPDDVDLLRPRIASLIAGETSNESIEVRIAGPKGHYIWSKINATLQKDAGGTPVRIVGLISDIDSVKRAEIDLKERSERDALTKLLNKASTQLLVSEYLNERDFDCLAALLILDIDNFKNINDSYGHLYGDAVLAQVGTSLRRLFRSDDIIGRIGGDEFLILLKNIPGEEMLKNRCDLLLNAFRELFSGLIPGLNVSFSIGCAIAPVHGANYSDLFQHADQALYAAKRQGKNTYVIYDPTEEFRSFSEGGSRITTNIESDEQPSMANNSFVRLVFHQLYQSRDIDATINDLLHYIGNQLNVSRTYIFENNDDNTACSNTFEWCNKGISSEKANLQNLSYITDLPGWSNIFDEKGLFYCSDVTQLPAHLRTIIEPQGIKSLLLCAITDGGVFRGYVGFDDCNMNRMWTQDQIDLLQFLAEVLAMFLMKKRKQDKIAARAKDLRSILDGQDAWVYVVDPETFSIKFLNSKIKSLAPQSREGMVCYRAFMDRESRCENCPIFSQGSKDNVIENNKLGICVKANASAISWDGSEAQLVVCRDIVKK